MQSTGIHEIDGPTVTLVHGYIGMIGPGPGFNVHRKFTVTLGPMVQRSKECVRAQWKGPGSKFVTLVGPGSNSHW
jgi:hypothetical protein